MFVRSEFTRADLPAAHPGHCAPSASAPAPPMVTYSLSDRTMQVECLQLVTDRRVFDKSYRDPISILKNQSPYLIKFQVFSSSW